MAYAPALLGNTTPDTVMRMSEPAGTVSLSVMTSLEPLSLQLEATFVLLSSEMISTLADVSSKEPPSGRESVTAESVP